MAERGEQGIVARAFQDFQTLRRATTFPSDLSRELLREDIEEKTQSTGERIVQDFGTLYRAVFPPRRNEPSARKGMS